MAQNQNIYLKAKKWVAAAVGALERDTVLPMAFARYDGNGFVGAENDTVTWKLPGLTTARDYEFRTRNNPIVLDYITRTSVSIQLNEHVYNAIPITDEENTLDVTSFAEEIVTPQVNAVAERMELKVANKLASLPFARTDLNAAAADDPFAYALAVKGVLDRQGTPTQGRKLILGTNAYAWMLQSESLRQYDPSQAQTAYRRATAGTIAGFDIVDGGALIDANAIYAVHSSAMVIANLAPAVPQGAVWGARRNYGGWSMRLMRDYDAQYLRDRSILSTFAGLSSVNDEYEREDGVIALDEDGIPVLTGKNVRGAKGEFSPSP